MVLLMNCIEFGKFIYDKRPTPKFSLINHLFVEIILLSITQKYKY